MPTHARTRRPGHEQLSLGDAVDAPALPSFGHGIRPDLDEAGTQEAFAASARALAPTFADPEADVWATSPYGWIRRLPPVSRGRAGAALIDRLLTAHGLAAEPASGAHDRALRGLRLVLKTSTLWTLSREYTFQQIRDGDYDALLLLGVSPHEAHLWAVPKDVALAHLPVGRSGAVQTRWLTIPADDPPTWLAPWGGPLSTALEALTALSHADDSTRDA